MNVQNAQPGDMGDHEIAELRAQADRAPWWEGQQMHRLLDAYEDAGVDSARKDELRVHASVSIEEIEDELESLASDVGRRVEDVADIIAEENPDERAGLLEALKQHLTDLANEVKALREATQAKRKVIDEDLP